MNSFDDERLYTWFYRSRSEFSFLRKTVWRIFGTKIVGCGIEDDGTKVVVVVYELKGIRLVWRLMIDGKDIET